MSWCEMSLQELNGAIYYGYLSLAELQYPKAEQLSLQKLCWIEWVLGLCKGGALPIKLCKIHDA